MSAQNCQICHRALRNQDSIRQGIGPECEAKYKRYLAAAGTTEAEIAALALMNDPTVTRWVSKIGAAIAAGRQKDVNAFLGAARRAAEVATQATLIAA